MATEIPLPDAVWTDLGAVPLALEIVKARAVYFVVAASAPADLNPSASAIGVGQSLLVTGASGHVYARPAFGGAGSVLVRSAVEAALDVATQIAATAGPVDLTSRDARAAVLAAAQNASTSKTTTEVTLSDGAWTDLGPVPLGLEPIAAQAISFVVAASQPSDLRIRDNLLAVGQSVLVPGSNGRVYARSPFGRSGSVRVRSAAQLASDVSSLITASGPVDLKSGRGRASALATVGIGTGGVTLTPSPANSSAPTITGTAQVGQTLTASNGSWTGSPTSYAYQWYRAGVPITGATSQVYAPIAADVGKTITVAITAMNVGGSGTATSAATGAVSAAATAAPASSTPGQISTDLSDPNSIGPRV